LREKLTSDDPLLPAVCAFALAKIHPDDKAAREQATKLLLSKLHDADRHVQSAAVRGLLELGTPPDTLAPELTSCIVECDATLVPEMMSVLAASGEAGVPALGAALGRRESRGQAAIALAHLGPKAAVAVPQLVGALSDEDPEVRREVLYALGATIHNEGPVDPAIIAALDDPDMRVRATAAYALGRAGPAASSAVPRLRRAVESSDPMVRAVGAWALAHIAPADHEVVTEILPVLMHATTSHDAMMRRGSVVALGMLGEAASAAAPRLKALTNDPDKTVRAAALEALEKIGAVVDAPPRRATLKKR
jgi:HEAT repeat protein